MDVGFVQQRRFLWAYRSCLRTVGCPTSMIINHIKERTCQKQWTAAISGDLWLCLSIAQWKKAYWGQTHGSNLIWNWPTEASPSSWSRAYMTHWADWATSICVDNNFMAIKVLWWAGRGRGALSSLSIVVWRLNERWGLARNRTKDYHNCVILMFIISGTGVSIYHRNRENIL